MREISCAPQELPNNTQSCVSMIPTLPQLSPNVFLFVWFPYPQRGGAIYQDEWATFVVSGFATFTENKCCDVRTLLLVILQPLISIPVQYFASFRYILSETRSTMSEYFCKSPRIWETSSTIDGQITVLSTVPTQWRHNHLTALVSTYIGA